MPILMLESDIEGKTTEYAYQKHCLHLKLNVLGRVGWPDHIYLYKGARIVFIEFKREGEKPRKIQSYVHSKLREYGFNVLVVDSFEQGCRAIDDLTHGNQDV